MSFSYVTVEVKDPVSDYLRGCFFYLDLLDAYSNLCESVCPFFHPCVTPSHLSVRVSVMPVQKALLRAHQVALQGLF